MNKQELAKYIDHTILKPEAETPAILKLCDEAREHGFASVCVNPVHVPLCAERLKGSGVDVCTVVGFPLGANATAIKSQEAALAATQGATELDMVVNVGALKDGKADFVQQDIKAVVDAVAKVNPKALVKVIIETCLLTDEEKKTACLAAKAAGAHFVKTSTGFGKGGATTGDIALMRAMVGPDMGVKASGGIKNYEQTMAMIKAGATRIGASAGIAIVERA
jgi:deoxyribose-phosphate aldolase